MSYEFRSVAKEVLASIGWLPITYDTFDAPFGYSDLVEETRDGQQVAVAYAIGTPEERAAASLAAAQTQAHALRTAERMRRQSLPFASQGYLFAADPESKMLLNTIVTGALSALITGQVAEAEALIGAGWRDADGVPRLKTVPQALQLQMDYNIHIATHDAASQAIAADITAAETVEEVEAIIAVIQTDSRWPT